MLKKERLYKLPEVAVLLGVEVGTVRRWVRAGVLPSKRIGRLYFVYGGDLIPERTLTKERESVE